MTRESFSWDTFRISRHVVFNWPAIEGPSLSEDHTGYKPAYVTKLMLQFYWQPHPGSWGWIIDQIAGIYPEDLATANADAATPVVLRLEADSIGYPSFILQLVDENIPKSTISISENLVSGA